MPSLGDMHSPSCALVHGQHVRADFFEYPLQTYLRVPRPFRRRELLHLRCGIRWAAPRMPASVLQRRRLRRPFRVGRNSAHRQLDGHRHMRVRLRYGVRWHALRCLRAGLRDSQQQQDFRTELYPVCRPATAVPELRGAIRHRLIECIGFERATPSYNYRNEVEARGRN